MPDETDRGTTKCRRKWIRRACVAGVFLFVGVLINVVVSWMIATTIVSVVFDGSYSYSPRAQVEPQWTIFLHESGPAAEHLYLRAHNGTLDSPSADPSSLPAWSVGREPPPPELWQGNVTVWEVATGWPSLSLRARSTDQAGITPNLIERGINIGLDTLPLRPIWSGFVINTAAYAVTAWLVFVLFTALAQRVFRRAIRQRRGHCPSCAYDLRGADHDVCPECGKANSNASTA